MNTKIIKLDINRRLYDKIVAKQDDTGSRFLLFQLLDGAVPFNLTDRSVRVYGVKPDGSVVFNDLTVTHSTTGFCLLELTNQMLAIAGTVKLELMITEGDKKLTSIPFEMEVIKKINSNAAVESSNEFGALLTALKEIDQWNREFADKSGKLEELYTPRLNELSSQLENIININETEKYILKETDNVQEILNTKKVIFIPNTFEIPVNTTFKTGFDGQVIEGNNSILRNTTTPSVSISAKRPTLQVQHKNVTIKNLTFIGYQKYNEGTTKEDNSTGHHIYISGISKSNLLIEKCMWINGCNGVSIENGTSDVVMNNCTGINCEHGFQVFNSHDVIVNNYIHKVKPYGESNGYTQRCFKIQNGSYNVTVNGAKLEQGRICGIYIRNEKQDVGTIKNIILNNIELLDGTSTLNGYVPYTGIYIEHEGNSTIENIQINNVNGQVVNNGFIVSKTSSGVIKDIILNNINVKATNGRTIGLKTGLADGVGYIDNLILNNIIGNDISIRATSGTITNVNTNKDIIGVNKNIMTNNICFPDGYFSLKPKLLTGTLPAGDRIPYPDGITKENIMIISAQVKNSNGFWLSDTYTLLGNSIQISDYLEGREYKIIYTLLD